MLEWPSTLALTLKVGAQKTVRSRVLRSKMDSGEEKIRLRDTAQVKIFTGEVAIKNRDQHKTFWDWFENSHFQGAEPFEWIDPFTGDIGTYYISSDVTESDAGGGVSSISFTLTELPS